MFGFVFSILKKAPVFICMPGDGCLGQIPLKCGQFDDFEPDIFGASHTCANQLCGRAG